MPTAPGAHPDNVVKGEKYRITVLADGLFRLEYDETGVFEDRATQVVFNRDFAPTEFTVKETEEELQIFTKRVQRIWVERPAPWTVSTVPARLSMD